MVHVTEYILRHCAEVTWSSSNLPTNRCLLTWHLLLALADAERADTTSVPTILIVLLLLHLLLLSLGRADLAMKVHLLLVLLGQGLCGSGGACSSAA